MAPANPGNGGVPPAQQQQSHMRPHFTWSRSTPNPPTNSPPQQGIQRAPTDSIFRPQPGNSSGRAQVPVTIRAYGLPWLTLKSHLETKFNIAELTVGHPQVSIFHDKFIIYLPRQLTEAEMREIEGMRIIDPGQQRRIEQRVRKTQPRDRDSDGE